MAAMTPTLNRGFATLYCRQQQRSVASAEDWIDMAEPVNIPTSYRYKRTGVIKLSTTLEKMFAG